MLIKAKTDLSLSPSNLSLHLLPTHWREKERRTLRSLLVTICSSWFRQKENLSYKVQEQRLRNNLHSAEFLNSKTTKGPQSFYSPLQRESFSPPTGSLESPLHQTHLYLSWSIENPGLLWEFWWASPDQQFWLVNRISLMEIIWSIWISQHAPGRWLAPLHQSSLVRVSAGIWEGVSRGDNLQKVENGVYDLLLTPGYLWKQIGSVSSRLFVFTTLFLSQLWWLTGSEKSTSLYFLLALRVN